MPLPNLLHPTPIGVQKIQRTQTLVDEDYREPIEFTSRSAQTTVPGQVKWGADKNARPSDMGVDDGADGYILFRRVDLRAAGLTDIEQGDRFVTMGSGANAYDVDLYVVKVRLEGHYADQGGATLVKAFFRDRHPIEQNRGVP